MSKMKDLDIMLKENEMRLLEAGETPTQEELEGIVWIAANLLQSSNVEVHRKAIIIDNLRQTRWALKQGRAKFVNIDEEVKESKVYQLRGNVIVDRERIQNIDTMVILEELATRLRDSPMDNPIQAKMDSGEWIIVKLQDEHE